MFCQLMSVNILMKFMEEVAVLVTMKSLAVNKSHQKPTNVTLLRQAFPSRKMTDRAAGVAASPFPR